MDCTLLLMGENRHGLEAIAWNWHHRRERVRASRTEGHEQRDRIVTELNRRLALLTGIYTSTDEELKDRMHKKMTGKELWAEMNRERPVWLLSQGSESFRPEGYVDEPARGKWGEEGK